MFAKRKIIITGDFFRFKEGAGPANDLDQISNIVWLYGILSAPLTHLGYEVVQWPLSKHDKEFIDLCRSFNVPSHLPHSPALWLSLYSRVHFSKSQLDMFKRIFSEAIIIALEPPDFLCNICKQCDIPLIEVIFHPVRYMPDLMLGIAVSGQSSNEALARYAVSDYEMKQEASLLKATNRRLGNPDFLKGWNDVLLLTGQTEVDRSLIRGGALDDLWVHRDKIIEIFSCYDYILYKPHPFMIRNQKSVEGLAEFFNSLRGPWEFRVTSMDYYWLLSQGIISANMSISSGSTVEAGYFGIDSHFLAEYPWRLYPHMALPGETVFYPIMHDYFYPDFWANLLGHHTAGSLPPNYKMRYQPNRLRRSLLQAWGASRHGFGTEKKLYDIETANATEVTKNTGNLAKRLENQKSPLKKAEHSPTVARDNWLTKGNVNALRRKLPFLSSAERVALVADYVSQAEANSEYLATLIGELVTSAPQLEIVFKEIFTEGESSISNKNAQKLAFEKIITVIQCSDSFLTLSYYEIEALKMKLRKE